jgi:hypothetical protein
MASDFTVIQAVRQQFGDTTKGADGQEYAIQVEQDAPFVGLSKDFRFSCPSVDSTQMAVLQFECLAGLAGSFYVTAPNFSGPGHRNIMRINGVDIPGDITPGPIDEQIVAQAGVGGTPPAWRAQLLLVPANVLNEENVLHIETVLLPTGQFDNFIIDNVVVLFKTRTQGRGGVGGVGGVGPKSKE